MQETNASSVGVFSWLRRMAGLIIGLYGAGVSLFTMLRLVITEQNQIIALFNTFGQLLWLAAIPLLLVVLVLRLWRVALLLLIPVAAFVFTFGPLMLGRANTPKGDESLTVMSYNLLGWRPGPDGNYSESLALIRQLNPDVLLLQEFSAVAAAQLPEALSDLYPYQAIAEDVWPTSGQAVFSRYPILEAEDIRTTFGHQRVLVDFDGTPLVFYNVHLHQPLLGTGLINVEPRQQEIAYFLERIAEEDSRVIFAGDMNLVELNEGYHALRQKMRDAFWDAGQGLGWTYRYQIRNTRIPALLRLDYVFYDSFGLEALNAQVWPETGGSDHHPVIIEMGLFDPTASYP